MLPAACLICMDLEFKASRSMGLPWLVCNGACSAFAGQSMHVLDLQLPGWILLLPDAQHAPHRLLNVDLIPYEALY